MITNEKIIYFGGKDWWYHNVSTGARFLRILARFHNECIYINPVSMRAPKIGRAGSGRRYLNKLKSFKKLFVTAERGIRVITPFFIPVHRGQYVQVLNSFLLRIQLTVCLQLIGWHKSNPIVFAATPTAILFFPSIRRKLLVYYLGDKYDKFRDISGKETIADMDMRMVRESDVLIAVSKPIYDHYKTLNPRCFYITHGVDFDLFNSAAKKTRSVPKDLRHIQPPIIGYFGSITESNDKNILSYMAEKRPKWNIVLIGEVISDYSDLKKYKNVYFLGKKALHELPDYGRHFDVCIMNWIMNDWMRYCSPVKTKEYLAMGKPVVSVPIPEVVRSLGDVVSIAATPSKFLDSVERELVGDSSERRLARIQKVASETWEKKVEEICAVLESVSRGEK